MASIIESEAENAFDWVGDYVNDQRAVNSAFMYVLTGEQAWADRAQNLITPVITGDQWAQSAKGLRLYMHGKPVALTYDLCYSGWTPSFRQTVSSALKAHADFIHDDGGSGQNSNPASNWQGNRFASGGLCYLATDDTYDAVKLDNCYGRVVRYCKENMGSDEDSRGWNIEGIGYLTYPWGQFIGPFGIAMARADAERDLREEMESVKWTLWTAYAAATAIRMDDPLTGQKLGLHPDFGDDNPLLRGEGVLGLAFQYAHEELVPGRKYWYDRLVGGKALGEFDWIRHGTIYGYLYYPADVTERKPLEIQKWLEGFVDVGGNGYMTWRNRYEDRNDMVAQLYLKLRGNKGHNGPDALIFRIIGMDTPWGVGGGRYGPSINGHEAYWSSMNTLYPHDPEDAALTVNGNKGTVVGMPYVRTDGGGHAVSSITKNNVGVDNQKRWFISDYSNPAGVEAVYVIGDESDDGYYWQMVTLVTQTITLNESSRSFVIQGRNGSSLKGTVLSQTGQVHLQKGTRARGSRFPLDGVNYNENNYVHCQSSSGDFVVVLTVASAQQSHPAVSLSGDAVSGAEITVGPKTYTLTEDGVLYDGMSPDYRPTAHIGCASDWAPAPATFQFDGSGSWDPEGKTLTYQWEFGDGATGSGETISHTYTADGTYTVELTVTDPSGNTDQVSQIVYVSPQPPLRDAIIEDTDDRIVYSPAWDVLSDLELYSGGTTHMASDDGRTATFTFHGSRIAIYTYSNKPDEQLWTIYLDDMKNPVFSGCLDRVTAANFLAWQSDYLPETTHTIKIVSGNKYTNIDYFEIKSRYPYDSAVSEKQVHGTYRRASTVHIPHVMVTAEGIRIQRVPGCRVRLLGLDGSDVALLNRGTQLVPVKALAQGVYLLRYTDRSQSISKTRPLVVRF